MNVIETLKKTLLTTFDLVKIYGLPIIAIIGFCTAVSVVRAGNQPPPTAVPVVEPSKAPFAAYVAGAGIVEATGENVAVASQVSGVVETVFVAVGQKVKAGDPLFLIDSRTAKAEVEVAKAELTSAKNQLDFISSLADKRAVSAEENTKRKNAFLVAEAKLNAAETELSKLTVSAQRDGTILKINTRPGEFAAAQIASSPLIILGNTESLWLRVDVDENDAWRVKPGASAVANLRGNSSLKTTLTFVRFEPYVIPKKSLTGDNSERVDTRVLQIIFKFDPQNLPVFVGQQMDVYIEGEKNG